MTGREMTIRALFVICPLGIATWILATYTVAESLNPRDSTLIGFSIALLAGAAATHLLVFSRAAEKPGSRLGVVLILCGTLCVLAAVASQFYLVSVTADARKEISRLMAEGMKTNPSFNVNLKADYPQSVQPIAYFALFAGIWLAAVGIKVGLAQSDLPAQVTPGPSPQDRAPPLEPPRL